MFTLKLMTIADYDAVYALWLRCAGMGLNNLDDSREGIEQYLKRNPTTCFTAVDGDTIIGVILAGHDGRRGFIYHTAVDPKRRKEGIGKALVDASMEALKTEGIHKTALVVFDRNETGNAFWEKVGFTKRTDLVYRNKNITELTRIDT